MPRTKKQGQKTKSYMEFLSKTEVQWKWQLYVHFFFQFKMKNICKSAKGFFPLLDRMTFEILSLCLGTDLFLLFSSCFFTTKKNYPSSYKPLAIF